MNRVSKTILSCVVVSLGLSISNAYASDIAFVIQSVKNNTGHNAVIYGFDDAKYSFSGSGNHDKVCIAAYNGKMIDPPVAVTNTYIPAPAVVRIDRRKYHIYNTGVSCASDDGNYFAILDVSSGKTYDKACIYAKEVEQQGFIFKQGNFAYLMNITFKSHTDSDGKTYNRPVLQRSNGHWCGFTEESDDGGGNCDPDTGDCGVF